MVGTPGDNGLNPRCVAPLLSEGAKCLRQSLFAIGHGDRLAVGIPKSVQMTLNVRALLSGPRRLTFEEADERRRRVHRQKKCAHRNIPFARSVMLAKKISFLYSRISSSLAQIVGLEGSKVAPQIMSMSKMKGRRLPSSTGGWIVSVMIATRPRFMSGISSRIKSAL